MAKKFKLPPVGVLWNKYYSYETNRIRELWFDKLTIFCQFLNEPDPCETSIIAWHNIIVLTELLKMRKQWDEAHHCPLE